MSYSDKNYFDRQCLIVVKDDRGMNQDDIDVFTRMNLPKELIFSTGRADLNTLYVAHPAQPGLYIPFEDHESVLFRDKMDELTLLLQALGATDVEIINNVNNSTENSIDKSGSFQTNASFKNLGAGFETDKNSSEKNSSSQSANYHLRIKSSPINAPKVPDGLHWYNLHPEWQKMVRQRLLGLEEYHLEISTSFSGSFSKSKLRNIKASLKIILFNLDANYNNSINKFSSKSQDSTWTLNIKFRPLSEYTCNYELNLTDKPTATEQTIVEYEDVTSGSDKLTSYRETCQSLITDNIANGKIPTDIKIELNRIREKLGLSADEAKAIEQEFVNSPKRFSIWPF